MASTTQTSRWIKCISTEGHIRGIAIQATELVQSVAKRHGLKNIAAHGLGEALVGGLLTGAYCKTGERINLNIQGGGLYKQALVDAHPDGTCRGYLIERPASEVRIAAGHGPWGEGLLSILRTKGGEGKQPYIGTVPLVTGHLAKDLTFYWMQSEQIPSAVGIAVELDAEGENVIAAGGFLVQAMPGASAGDVRVLDQHIQEIHALNQEVASEADPKRLLARIFQSTAFVLVEEKPLVFECNCTSERVERALALIGPDELQSMLDEGKGAKVHCDFCSKVYTMTQADLNRLLAVAKG